MSFIEARSRTWEPCAEGMGAAEVTKRNGKEIQEHSSLGHVNTKEEERMEEEEEEEEE